VPITVGIPFHNAEATLPDAIRSVFAQSYADWELLLVDDGSDDRSLELARAVKDPRVRVIADGARRRLPARLNQIVAEARFGCLARMDADDLMSPRRFDRQIRALDETGADIVTSSMAMLSAALQPIGIRSGKPTISARAICRGQSFAHAPLMAKTAWFVRNRYDEASMRVEDAELWLRAFRSGELTTGSVLGIEEPLYFCREEAGISAGKVLVAHANLRRLIRGCGPTEFSTAAKLYELGRSHSRCLALRILGSTGLLGRATSFVRNHAIADPAVEQRIRTEVELVRSTKVPGLG
jgi:glycosyltransferase involved in cell wall biosynthesis